MVCGNKFRKFIRQIKWVGASTGSGTAYIESIYISFTHFPVCRYRNAYKPVFTGFEFTVGIDRELLVVVFAVLDFYVIKSCVISV